MSYELRGVWEVLPRGRQITDHGAGSVVVVDFIGEQHVDNFADDQDALHDGRHVGTEQSQQFPQDHLLARGMWMSGHRPYSGDLQQIDLRLSP